MRSKSKTASPKKSHFSSRKVCHLALLLVFTFPTNAAIIVQRQKIGWGVVQLVARGTLDPEVPGSKPGAPAKISGFPRADRFGERLKSSTPDNYEGAGVDRFGETGNDNGIVSA